MSISHKISDQIQLAEIKISDYQELYNLMSRIYPGAYQYLWEDDCSWYLNHIYSIEAVTKDIDEVQSLFYFVIVEGKKIGILRIQLDKPYPDQPELRATRLHRIYLAEEIQGKGVSKLLMQYVIDIAKENGSELLWLDCMDTKHQALKYYEKNGFKKGTLSFLDFELLIDKYRGIYLMCKVLKAEV
ncbi:MAG: GNAT superfamily N-acetyltransferase [Halioglobus sp.]|jgi:GNAT superfamily N-acetyltransferase